MTSFVQSRVGETGSADVVSLNESTILVEREEGCHMSLPETLLRFGCVHA